MTTALWIAAFFGVIIIYASKPMLRLFGVSEPSEGNLTMVKWVGIALAGVALIILFTTGRFS